MRKQYAVFIALILIPSVYGIQIDYLDNFSAKEEIRGLETGSKSVFTTTKNYVQRLSGEPWTLSPPGHLSWEIDSGRDQVLVGTRNGGSSLFLYSKTGKLRQRIDLDNWVDGLGMYRTAEGKILAASSVDDVEFYRANGTRLGTYTPSRVAKHIRDSAFYIDGDSEKEVPVNGGRSGKGLFQLVELDGDREWETDWLQDGYGQGIFLPGNGMLVWYKNGLQMRNATTGRIVWQVSESGIRRPANLTQSIVYSNATHLVRRGYEEGGIKDMVRVGSPVEEMIAHPSKKLLVGYQGSNVSLFSEKGERLASLKIGSFHYPVGFSDMDTDRRKEIVAASGQKIHVFETNRGKKNLNQSLEETMFIGSGKPMLKAISLNQTSIVTESYSDVEKTVRQENLTPLGVGDIEGISRID
ncbi:MAG: hypothetical protein ABEJ72_05650, partial [Candidatus Aenigmatarchaeota archaeon]